MPGCAAAADWRLTLLPMAAAVAIIPLTASLALKFTGSTRTALIAASLAAFNPYLVMWGPAIRAYSLLVALSLLAINEFFHWYQQRDWWSGVRCAAVVLLLLLAHLNGVYTVAFLVLLLAAETIFAGWSERPKVSLGVQDSLDSVGGVAIIVGIAYWRLLPDIAKVNREWGTDTPPTSMGYLPQVFTAFMGVGYAALLSVLLLLAGCWSAVREKRALLLLCGAIILGPILMSLQGVSVPSWAFARYLIFSLPLLLILIAEGIDWLARHVWMRRGAAIVAWGLTAIVVFCWTPFVRAQFLAKKQWPYARVAKFLHTQMQKNDVIVAGWSIGFTLSQFFDDSEDRIMLPDKYVSKVANQLDAPLPGRVFYVTGPGFLNGSEGARPAFRASQKLQSIAAIPRGRCSRNGEKICCVELRAVLYAPFQDDYQLLALLEERLPSGQSADHWRSLAEQLPRLKVHPRVMFHAT